MGPLFVLPRRSSFGTEAAIGLSKGSDDMNGKRRTVFLVTGLVSLGLLVAGYWYMVSWALVVGLLALLVSLIGLFSCASQRRQFEQGKAYSRLLPVSEEQVGSMYCLFLETMPMRYYQSVLDSVTMEKFMVKAFKKLKNYFGEKQVHRISRTQFVVLQEFNLEKVTDYEFRDRYLEKIANFVSTELALLVPTSDKDRLKVNDLVIGAAASGYRYQMRNIDDLIELAFFSAKLASEQKRRFLVSDEKIRAMKLNNDECKAGFLKKNWIEEFNPFFQPLIDSETYRIIGFESVARWQLGGMRILEAKVFRDLADDMDYLHAIDTAIIEKTFEAAGNLHSKELVSPSFLVVINLSDASIKNFSASRLRAMAEKHCLNPDTIELDINDNAMSDPMLALNIQEFRNQGFRIALDIFEKQAFDLNAMFLNRFDTIKLDYSSYSPLYNEQGVWGNKIYSSLVSMALSLSIKPLAKGIENKAQMDAAKKHGAILLQGNYFSSPVTESAFELFAKKYRDGLYLDQYSLA
jgi:EAL domain-containing protein (putative c-di-GMP-specific phosphodiesterase class I)